MFEFELTNKLNLILFVICSYVTTTGTAIVTIRSIILYKDVFSKKLSILDCVWV